MFSYKVGDLARKPQLVTADATMTQAADAISGHRTSCLAVVSGNRVVGFLMERELVRHLDVDMDPDAPIRDLVAPPSGAIPADMPVLEAARLMLERRMFHLPVLDKGGGLLGLVSDKDLVDALAVDFMVESVQCRELMRSEPVTIDPGRPVREALDLMRRADVGSVLATSEDRPVGMFTERDVTTKIMGHAGRLLDPVSRHMTAPVVSVPVDALVYKVILFMRQKGMRRVAVVEADGTLAGVLTLRNILAHARRFR